MGKASRDKGKRGEREARDQVRMLWNSGPRCIRAAQSCGAFSADILNALPSSHVEVKRYARISSTRFLEQAIADAQEDELPLVLMREDNGMWLLLLRLSDSPEFSKRLVRQLTTNEPLDNQDPD